MAARRGLQISPNDSANAWTLIYCFRALEDFEMAMQWAEHALALDRDQPLVLQELANLSRMLGDNDASRDWVERLRQLGDYPSIALFEVELEEDSPASKNYGDGSLKEEKEPKARDMADLVAMAPMGHHHQHGQVACSVDHGIEDL